MSQLFEPFRAIGYVCDAVPAALQQRGTETFVAVAVGHSIVAVVVGSSCVRCWVRFRTHFWTYAPPVHLVFRCARKPRRC